MTSSHEIDLNQWYLDHRESLVSRYGKVPAIIYLENSQVGIVVGNPGQEAISLYDDITFESASMVMPVDELGQDLPFCTTGNRVTFSGNWAENAN